MEIVRQAEVKEELEYTRVYEWAGENGAGFSFPCDENGEVDLESLQPAARKNYLACEDGTFDVIDRGILKTRRRWNEPAIGKCVCGRNVSLGGFTNHCDCGRLYNWNGSELTDPSTWGEDTGEHPEDILRIR
ncbi:MAG TPA: hypothetical protein PKV86_00520 [Syntrophobacteraceae bacterium]|nr:hypothetical protein [Syntrophobacteraceae bacterium]